MVLFTQQARMFSTDKKETDSKEESKATEEKKSDPKT
jgi:hypothetical protein